MPSPIPSAMVPAFSVVASSTSNIISTEPYQLLIAVPKQKGVKRLNACPICRGHVILRGTNDGVLCTRCFNRENEGRTAANNQAAALRSTNVHAVLQDTTGMPQPPVTPGSSTDAGLAELNAQPAHVDSSMAYPASSNKSSNDVVDEQGLEMNPGEAGGSAAAQTGSAEVAGPGQDAGEDSTFDPEFDGPDDAMEFLLHPPAGACYTVNILEEEDDWKLVQEGGTLNQHLVDELFKAISKEPTDTPDFGDEIHQTLHYNKAMKTALAAIKAKMEDERVQKMAKGSCMMAIEQVVHVNKIGIPMTVVDAAKSSSRKRKPDRDMKCSERACELIRCVGQNKLVAADVMERRSLNAMAYSPAEYVKAKIENTKSNANRALKTVWEKRQKAAEAGVTDGLSNDAWYEAYCQSLGG